MFRLAARTAAALCHARARVPWPPFASGDGEGDGYLLVVNGLVLILGFSQGGPAGSSDWTLLRLQFAMPEVKPRRQAQQWCKLEIRLRIMIGISKW